MGKISEDMVFGGSVRVGTLRIDSGSLTNSDLSSNAEIARAKLAQDTNQPFVVPLSSGRVHDAIQTLLPGTAANDDLAFDSGTFGTVGPHITAGNLGSAGAVTRYARFQVALPAEYDDGETITIRIHAGMQTAVADTSCTVDVECYRSDEDTTVSADLCTTSATTMNNLTFADIDFAITPTSREPGDILDVRIAIACNDGATGTVEPTIGAIKLLCDIRG